MCYDKVVSGVTTRWSVVEYSVFCATDFCAMHGDGEVFNRLQSLLCAVWQIVSMQWSAAGVCDSVDAWPDEHAVIAVKLQWHSKSLILDEQVVCIRDILSVNTLASFATIM